MHAETPFILGTDNYKSKNYDTEARSCQGRKRVTARLKRTANRVEGNKSTNAAAQAI